MRTIKQLKKEIEPLDIPGVHGNKAWELDILKAQLQTLKDVVELIDIYKIIQNLGVWDENKLVRIVKEELKQKIQGK